MSEIYQKELSPVRSGVLGRYDDNNWSFVASWNITGRCPYHCSYCYESNSPKRTIEPQLSTLASAIPRLKTVLATHIAENRRINIRLFGGEPTAHRDFLPFLSLLRIHFPNAILSCQSNGYRPLSFFKKILSIDPHFIFNISVHFEYIDENMFMKKIEYILSKNATINISLQFLPDARIQIYRFADKIINSFPSLHPYVHFLRSRESSFKELLAEYTPEDYAFAKYLDERNRKIEDNYFIDYVDSKKNIWRRKFTFHEAFHADISNFRGAHCIWPMQRLTIREDGSMNTGFCLPNPCINIFSNKGSTNIFDTSAPSICTREFCACRGMRDAAKFFDPEFAPLYLGGSQRFAHDVIECLPYPLSS